MEKTIMNKPGCIEELTRTLFHAMNTRDYDLFEQITAEEVAFDFPGVGRVEGRRRTLLVIKSILRKFPRLHFNISEVIAREDRSCAVWNNTGESSTGTPYTNSGMTLVHITQGKISFISDYFKDTSFTQ
jgi:ketosteroid isomerase-like protein